MDNPEYNSYKNQRLIGGEVDLPSQEEIYNYQNQNKETQNFCPPPAIEQPSPPPITNIIPQQNFPQEEIQKVQIQSNIYPSPNIPIEEKEKSEEQPPFPIPIAYNINEPIQNYEPNPVQNNNNQPIPNVIIDPIPVSVITENPEIVVNDPIIVSDATYPEINQNNNNIKKNENIQPVSNQPQNVNRNDDLQECDNDECCQALLCFCLLLRCIAIIAGGR